MGENEYIGNCSANYEKEQTLKAIENYLELCKNLWESAIEKQTSLFTLV